MTTQRHVLITGASRGIGLGLADRYLARGDAVLITGRSAERLAELARTRTGLLTLASDAGSARDRVRLAAFVAERFGELDTVVNNAGIQRRVGLAVDDAAWEERQSELDVLLAAPVQLNSLLIPTLVSHGRPSVIVNVTSGGAFVPQPFAPLYSAAKAALHSYTVNLRLALSQTSCRVVELIPPAVATGLGGGDHGAPLDEFCDSVFPRLDGSAAEVGFGVTEGEWFGERLAAERAMFDAMAGRFPVDYYRDRTSGA